MPWRGPEEPGEFPTGGYIAQEWIEENLLITDGPKIGQPFQLYDEQVMHLLNRYRIAPDATEDDGNDAFRFGGSMIVRGQKWGKDPLIAAIDLFHAFGPCDFAGWDANGEPVLRPHPSPWVFVAALNDSQVANTWLPLKAMVESSSLVDLPGVDVNLDMIRLPSGNRLECLTTTAWGRLGSRFTAGSLTENGVMTDTVTTGAGGGKRSALQFAETVIRNVDGMGGMWIAATNTWDPTEMSHAQRVYEAKDPHIYVDARIARKRVDLAHDEDLRREVIWLYGDSIRENGGHQSSQRIMRSVRDKSKAEANRRRFFLSEILAGETPLCTPERWAALGRGAGHPDYRPLEAGEAITLGFDGSRARDATVLTAVRIRDGRVFHLRTWLPSCMCGPGAEHRPEECKDRRIPRDEVDQAVQDAFDGYDVWFLLGDPYKWQEYLAMWAARWPGKVLEVPTNVESRMDQMVELWITGRDRGEYTHDGNADLTEHVRSAAIAKGRRKASKPRTGDDGQVIEHYLKVVKKDERVLIDAAISMLLALYGRGRAIEGGAMEAPGAPAPEPVAVEVGAMDDGLPDLDTVRF